MMIRRAFAAVVLGLALIPMATDGPIPEISTRAENRNVATAAEAEVWRVIEGFNEAFSVNDSARYFKYIDEREEFEFGLRLGYGRVGYFQELQPQINVYGDVAVVTYFSRGSYGPDDKAETHTRVEHETTVVVRRRP